VRQRGVRRVRVAMILRDASERGGAGHSRSRGVSEVAGRVIDRYSGVRSVIREVVVDQI